MPLKPNIIERFLINRGTIPGVMTDLGLPLFQLYAMLGAMEIGFFRHLKDKPADVTTLAQRTGCSERGLKILIQALKPMGYVKEKNQTYSLTKQALRMPIDLLQPMAPYFQHQAAETLPELGRGLREAPEEGIYGWEHLKSGEVGRGYQASMRWLASGMVDQIVKKISLPSGARRMLDLGGSHGLYTVAFYKKYPELESTILDWEIGLDEARKTLEDHPEMKARISLLERDFEKEELPGGFDFIFLGNIIHGISPEGNRELFGKLGRATTDRGMVGILDQFEGISGSNFARAVAGLAGLNLFLFSGGRAYPIDKVKSWLSEAGFEDSALHKLKQPGMSLLTAKK